MMVVHVGRSLSTISMRGASSRDVVRARIVKGDVSENISVMICPERLEVHLCGSCNWREIQLWSNMGRKINFEVRDG